MGDLAPSFKARTCRRTPNSDISAAPVGLTKPPPQVTVLSNLMNTHRLNETRDALLNLHKALVDSERVRYEKVVGEIKSPSHFLQLLTDDPWFAWLHPLS